MYGTQVSSSVDLTASWTPADTTSSTPEDFETDGLSDPTGPRVVSLLYAPKTSKGQYFQLRVTNGALDESFYLLGVTYRLAGLDARGVSEAKSQK